MNDRSKRAGQSTRRMADKRYRSRVWFILLVLAIALLILVLVSTSQVLDIGGLVALIFLVVVLASLGFTIPVAYFLLSRDLGKESAKEAMFSRWPRFALAFILMILGIPGIIFSPHTFPESGWILWHQLFSCR